MTPLQSRLSKLQIKTIADQCCDRIISISNQLENRWERQDNYILQSEDNFEWRGKLGEEDPSKPTAIFGLQNDSLNMIGGFKEYMTARTSDDLLGSMPFFSASPEGKNDKILADTLQKHAEWRINRADLVSAFLDAINIGYTTGEGVIKVTNDQKTLYSERSTNVLITMDGEFILTHNGDYIEDSTPIIEEQDETTATMRVFPEGMPEIDLSEGFDYKQIYIPETINQGDALTAHVLHHRDFLCPITASDPQTADFVAHLFDMPVAQAKAKWKIDKETLDFLSKENSQPKSEENKPNQDSDEQAEPIIDSPDSDNAIAQFAECYLQTTIAGNLTKIFVIVAVSARKIIYIDYLANVTPKGITPFFAVRPFPQLRRWWGRGMFELYAYAQEFIERHLNYISHANRYHSNPVLAVQRGNIINASDGEDITISPGATIELKTGKTLAETIEVFAFPSLDEKTWDILELMMQSVQLRSGVTSASQGGIDAMPQNSTATGVNAILNAGNVISKLPIRHIRQALEEATKFSVMTIYANLDEDETFSYLEGENAKILSLSRKDIQDIEMNIKMTMNRFRQREQAESANAAIQAINMYIQTPEPEKDAVRPLYISALKAHGIDDADRVVRRAASMQEQAPAPMPL